MELDRRGAELLFQVLTEREEQNAVAIASNDSRIARFHSLVCENVFCGPQP